jgi:hypothetical protein
MSSAVLDPVVPENVISVAEVPAEGDDEGVAYCYECGNYKWPHEMGEPTDEIPLACKDCNKRYRLYGHL